MHKLIVLPGSVGIGGTTVSLSLMLKGFEQYGASNRLRVLVNSGSVVEQYLRHAGQSSCLELIEADSPQQFCRRAFEWIAKQPKNWPLLLENGVARFMLSTILLAAPCLRLSGRPIYYSFRNPACSDYWLGNLTRKFIFACLAPVAICNSRFTADNVLTTDKAHPRLLSEVKAILYPPVDTERFNPRPHCPPPEPLQPILQSGARIMLTPSRISQPEQFNDKNLRGLLYVLAQLKARGHYYHGIVIGQDTSAEQRWTHKLLQEAKDLGVEERFTVLPATFSIKDYYNYADIVVTLAPREPFGRTVVEAIACGVPVVGSRTGGIREILDHFAPEWTVDPFDPEAAADVIIRIASDPNTPNLLAQGRRWVEEQCNPAQYARRIMEITGLDSIKQFERQNSQQVVEA